MRVYGAYGVFGLRSYVKDWLFLRPAREWVADGLNLVGIHGVIGVGQGIMRTKRYINARQALEGNSVVSTALHEIMTFYEDTTPRWVSRIESAVETSAQFRDAANR